MGGGKLNTKNLKKKGFVLLLSLFCMSFVFAQIDEVQQNDASGSALYQEESNLLLENPENQVLFPNETERGGLWPFIRMVLVLAIIIGGIYLVFFFIKKSKGGAGINDAFLQKVASLTLSPGKTIHIITLLDKAYLVGVAESSINLLAEIKDKELVDTLNLNVERETENQAPDFASLLSLFMPKQKTEEKTTEQFYSDNAMETLKGHKDRLGKKLFDEGDSL